MELSLPYIESLSDSMLCFLYRSIEMLAAVVFVYMMSSHVGVQQISVVGVVIIKYV